MSELAILKSAFGGRTFDTLVEIIKETDQQITYQTYSGDHGPVRTYKTNISVRNATPELFDALKKAEAQSDFKRAEYLKALRSDLDSTVAQLLALHGGRKP